MTPPPLPPGYTIRRPTPADIDAVFALTTRWSVGLHGAPDFNREDLESDWQGPDFHLDTDAWVVAAPDGTLAGYADVWKANAGEAGMGVRVDPSHRGRGIGTYLLALAERRARQLVAAPVEAVARQWVSSADAEARHIVAAAGYTVVRRFWRMKIELREQPPAPQWPAGVVVRTLAEGLDTRAMHAATEEAFADHWGHTPVPYDVWARREIERGDFDPALWFVADDVERREIAGVVHARMNGEMGFIDELTVRRAWRHRGLGMALLRQVFAAFYARGMTTVGLGVDAQNVTGATRLYERAGMRVYQEWDIYEKILRADRNSSSVAAAEEDGASLA